MKSRIEILSIALYLLALTPAFSQLDSSNLPILVIETRKVIVDNPKVRGTIKVFSDHPSGYNKTSHTPTFVHDIGIEYRGQTSQEIYPKKGFGFEFRNKDHQRVKQPLLGMPTETDWVIHSPYGDKTLIRNALAYDLARDIFDYSPRQQFCELIVNDDYYGVVLLTERLQIDPGRIDIERPRGPEDLYGGYIFKFDKGEDEEVVYTSSYIPSPESKVRTKILLHDPLLEELSRIQKRSISQFFSRFERMLDEMDLDEDEEYEEWLDEKSFTRYMLFSELTRNVDAYRISSYFYKEDGSKGGRLKAGPVWDYNIAFGNANYCDGYKTSGWAWDFNAVCPDHDNLVHFWWKRLLQNEEFEEELVEEYRHLRKHHWSDENILQLIDDLTAPLTEAGVRNFERWDVIGVKVWPNYFVGRSYQEEIDYLKDWMLERLAWMDDHVKDVFDNHSHPGFISHRTYPNPASDLINLEFRSVKETFIEVKMQDMHGRDIPVNYSSDVALKFHEIAIPVSGLSGMYNLQFIVNDHIVVNDKVIITGR